MKVTFSEEAWKEYMDWLNEDKKTFFWHVCADAVGKMAAQEQGLASTCWVINLIALIVCVIHLF